MKKNINTTLAEQGRLPYSVHALIATGLLIVAFAHMGYAHAQNKPATTVTPAKNSISVHLEQFKVVKKLKEPETFIDVAAVKPGDLIEYRATYKNNDKSAVKGMVATIPIPIGTDFIPKSIRPENSAAEATTKTGIYAAIPLMHPVRQSDGKIRSEPVPATDYRAIRWNLGQLAAGASTTVIVRVQVPAVVAPVVQNDASDKNLTLTHPQ